MRLTTWLGVVLAFLWLPGHSSASVAVLLEEPYGYDGAFGGVGHAAVYLNRVCAASPTSLRRCVEGEYGVVISRYNRIGGYDWIAIPLIPYLYAVARPEDIPTFADNKIAGLLRDQYRHDHLQELVPDAPVGQAPGNWVQLVGSSYNRTTFTYELETTAQQDDELIGWLNGRPNRPIYRVVTRNCADFVRDIVNFYYPKAVSRGIVADFGMTTPKRVARSISKYSRRHSDLEFVSRVIPQVPGTIRRSKPVHGMAESVFKAKKYVLALAFFQPYVAGGFAAAYLVDGRFKTDRKATIFSLDAVESSVAVNQRRAYQTNLHELPISSEVSATKPIEK
ncbi:MAG TPA: hypothetical protein VNY51_13110 [Candidatus Dormibacteraeota bacterium]|nr:hypothetical protein [Candidatus Dormibacteraeota bacterium]